VSKKKTKKIKKVKDHELLQANNYLKLGKRVDALEVKIDKLANMIDEHIRIFDTPGPIKRIWQKLLGE